VLNAEIGKRQQGQKVIWDLKQVGLCVLVSPGPKDRRKATLTFRRLILSARHAGQAALEKATPTASTAPLTDVAAWVPTRDARGEPEVVRWPPDPV